MAELETDVCVVGAGPAGVAAATVSAEWGARTTLVDDGARPGGQIWRGPRPARAEEWIARAEAAGVEIRSSATVVHAPTPDRLIVSETGGLLQVRARSVVLACGSRERFLPFPGWTLPNVIGVGGLQALVKGGLHVEGKRIVIAGSGPLMLTLAADLEKLGATVAAIVEQAPRTRVLGLGARAVRSASRLKQAIGLARDLSGIRRLYRAWPVEATGRDRISGVTVYQGSRRFEFDCDYLACGFGLVPETTLARLIGCEIADGRVTVDAHQQTSIENVYCAGEPTGIAGVEAALLEGQVAGHAAAGSAPPGALLSHRDQEHRWADALRRAFALDPALRELPNPDTIVCRCENVTLGQLRGFDDARDAKLQTRCAMGPCQGRICGPALSFCLGLETSRPRPPIFPIPLSQLIADPGPSSGP